jgi:hypothetical protein
MKSTCCYYLLPVMLFLACSCQKEAPDVKKPGGRLKIEIGLFIHVSEVNGNLKSTSGPEDFRVTIYSASGEEVLVFERASEMPGEIELEAGDYYVTAHSDNNIPAAFENPYYYGESDVFTVNPGAQQSVVVTCELANTMVSIVYSESVINSFTDYSTTVSSTAGSLVFTKTETRSGYFQPLSLNIAVLLTWEKADGTIENRTLSGSIPDPQPKKHYEIHVNATAGGSSALILVNLDESVDPVEIVPVTDSSPADGPIGNGDLLITEIMYDPTALSDANGEWIEIYNNTDRTINLQNLVFRKDDDFHVVAGDVALGSHNYFILARTNQAVISDHYVYGTGISLNNTGAVLALCNYGNDGSDGSIIFSVDYGTAGFPSATGSSLSLNPNLLNQSDARLASSCCISATAYSTGDLGTPGLINDSCN